MDLLVCLNQYLCVLLPPLCVFELMDAGACHDVALASLLSFINSSLMVLI